MMPGFAIIFGFLAATAALLVQVFFSFFVTSPLMGTLALPLIIGAATIEESMKLLFLIQLGKRSTGVVSLFHAFLFGIGFVAVEAGLLIFSTALFPGLMTLGTIIGIQLIGTFIIYGGLRFREQGALSPVIALLAAILVHVLYNASL